MAEPRDHPYVWATWVSRFMAGEVQCTWSTWFKAHYMYERLPSDFNLAKWTAEHTELVREHDTALRAEGYKVLVEDQNAFRIRGRDEVMLSGKPDLVAQRGEEICVIDCKTGTPKTSDNLQVLIYMLILPYARPRWRHSAVQGRVQYKHASAPIPAEAVDDRFRAQFRQAMERIGGSTALVRLPSYGECRFCDISRHDCLERVDTPPSDITPDEHDLF